ncbi:hypothetical protein [Luteolibacter sp. LG18]|uniref:hypothetical protein n=1 Tax=Luteolibacter sp. LG18 TaxID=2819286 RepID=UPI002B2FE12C|nr:hypothetical protein llg_11880 [Luteolibacter sp. LG18]
MNLKHIPIWGTVGAWALCGSLTTLQPARAIPAEEQQQEGVETLTRGPVHEAFAETISYNPTPGLIVKKEPPAAIEEVPPEQQLVGTNVTWIPGYWAWDDETADFIWISGIWRNLPPGRQWVPGYWNPLDDGYQWVSGYWSDAKTEEVTYLPEPPASLERGPSVVSTSDNDVWIPGSWLYQEDRYAWSPGYWQPAQPEWTWIPSHYSWTPHGYVYVPGYWDYDVPRRGVLFAPVHFASGYYSRPGFLYSPLTVISLAIFGDHLFLRPNYGHYYYGDYYAPRYSDSGFYAAYSFNSGRRGFDPIFAKEIWLNRKDKGWLHARETDFMFRRDNENARPPRNWAALQALAQAGKPGKGMAFVTPLSQYAKDPKGPMKFKTLAAPDKAKFIEQKKEMVKFAMDRKKLEGSAKGDAPKLTAPAKLQLAKSPIMGRSADKLAKGEAPPKLPMAKKAVIPGDENLDKGKGKGKGDTAIDDKIKPGPGPKIDTPDEGKGKKGMGPKSGDSTEPKGGEEPRRKVVPQDTPRGDMDKGPKSNTDKGPKIDPDKGPKVEPKKVIPKEAPEKKEIERKVIPQDTPKVERREVPKVEPKVVPKLEPKVQPKPQPEPKQVERVVPKGPQVAPSGGSGPQSGKGAGKDREKGKKDDN